MNNLTTSNIYKNISELLTKARTSVQKTVDSTMTYTYFEIGRMIVEEQKGNNRTKYGKELIKNISINLSDEFGKGFGVRNIELMKKFYLVFSNDEKTK